MASTERRRQKTTFRFGGILDWPHLSDCRHSALTQTIITHIIIVKYKLSNRVRHIYTDTYPRKSDGYDSTYIVLFLPEYDIAVVIKSFLHIFVYLKLLMKLKILKRYIYETSIVNNNRQQPTSHHHHHHHHQQQLHSPMVLGHRI